MSDKWEIFVTKRFEKDYNKLPKQLIKRVNDIVDTLKENPYRERIIRKLGVRKVRIGNYRLLYSLDEERKIIILLTIIS